MSSLYTQLETVRRQKEELVEEQLKSVAKTGARVVLVSRRLPFTLRKKTEHGQAGWTMTDVSDLDTRNQSLQNMVMIEEIRDCLWVGWPGVHVPSSEQPKLREWLLNPRNNADQAAAPPPPPPPPSATGAQNQGENYPPRPYEEQQWGEEDDGGGAGRGATTKSGSSRSTPNSDPGYGRNQRASLQATLSSSHVAAAAATTTAAALNFTTPEQAHHLERERPSSDSEASLWRLSCAR